MFVDPFFGRGIFGRMFAFVRGVRGWARWSYFKSCHIRLSRCRLERTFQRPCTPGIPKNIPLKLQRPAKQNFYAFLTQNDCLNSHVWCAQSKEAKGKKKILSCKRVKREQVRRNVAEKKNNLLNSIRGK